MWGALVYNKRHPADKQGSGSRDRRDQGSQTMAIKLNHQFSFSDDDLQTFVKQYKATAAAKGMVPSLRSVDERLANSKKIKPL